MLGHQAMALIDLRRESASLVHAERALEVATRSGVRHALVSLDSELRILGWSGDAEILYGYQAAAVTGKAIAAVLESDATDDARRKVIADLEGEGEWVGDVTHHRANGSPVRVRVHLEAQRNTTGARTGYVANITDLTSPEIEQLSHQTYADIVTKMANGKSLVTLAADLCHVVEKAFPGSRATLMAVDARSEHLGVIAAPSLSTQFANAFAEVPIGPEVGACGSSAYLAEVVISEDISTDPRWQDWRGPAQIEGLLACWSHPIIGPSGSVLGTFAVYWDRPHVPSGDEHQLVATLAALASIVLTARRGELDAVELDGLTQLMSRAGIDRALARLSSDRQVCVIALGVDRFGLVNRQYGLDVGDSALREISQRVRSVASEDYSVGRFASDQFVLMRAASADSSALANELVASLREPIVVDGNELWLTASVGLASGPAVEGQAVLHAAIAAADKARRLGGNQILNSKLPPGDLGNSSLDLVGSLHRAVSAGELAVHYQPKVRISSGCVEGLEGLVRWTRRDGTFVSPAEFIPMAEEIGLIGTIGEQVLRTACRGRRNVAGQRRGRIAWGCRQCICTPTRRGRSLGQCRESTRCLRSSSRSPHARGDRDCPRRGPRGGRRCSAPGQGAGGPCFHR